MKIKVDEKKIILITLGIIVGISIVISSDFKYSINNFTDPNPDNMTIRTSKLSEKIYIDNNWTDAKTAGICTGNGTPSDPYIIEDLEIDAGDLGSSILIENSNVNFIIQNCTLTSSGPEFTDSGIKLINVDNGNLINNTATGNSVGIYMEICENFVIVNNNLKNEFDMQVVGSTNILMYLNDFKSNFINLFFQNASFTCRSPKKINYIYDGKSFTKYLGNYWSGYTGPDHNNDGIGDTTHIFYDSTTYDVDYYPLYLTTDNYIIKGFAKEGLEISAYQSLCVIGVISFSLIILLRRRKRLRISS